MIKIAITAAAYDAIRSTLPQDAPLSPVERQGGQNPDPRSRRPLFISPVLAEAAMEGRLPRGFCVKRLTDLPMLWSEQWRAVGLQQPIQAQAEPI